MGRWGPNAAPDEGARYAAQFEALAADGLDVDAEAKLCAALLPPPARVLDAGCGTGRVMIWLAERGYDCVGVDYTPPMLVEARRRAPDLPWFDGDLRTLDLPARGVPEPFDLVVAAGNVIPLAAGGTEGQAVAALARHLRPGGLLVAGFGLDHDHLKPEVIPVPLADYDAWCAASGLEPVDRYATWDREPYDGGGYAVSLHRRSA